MAPRDISVDGEQLVQVATQDVTVAPVPCEMVALFPGGKCINPEAVYVKSLMLSRPLWAESFARLQRRLDSGALEPPPALGSVPDGLRWCTAEEDPTPDYGRRFCKAKAKAKEEPGAR